MSLARRALWTIDRNLRQDLTLGSVAGACGVSRYHLAHAFGGAVGMSVMEYARCRRLSEAAAMLAAGASNILDLALEYGYGSHEAFSRAFRSRFGVTPETVRRDGSTDGLVLVPPMAAAEVDSPPVAAMRIEQSGALAFVGLAEHIRFGEQDNIAAQWSRFMPHYGEIAEASDPIPWGVSANIDDDGNFDYLCALKVTRVGAVPKGLSVVKLPPHRYAVFLHDAHVSTIAQTFAAIWNAWPAPDGCSIADDASLERHLPTFNTQTGFGGIEIWVPLR